MSDKRAATAALVLRRPAEPITDTAARSALANLADLLNVDLDDVRSIHYTPGSVRVELIPRFRGRAQHDSAVRVTYPIVFDPESDES